MEAERLEAEKRSEAEREIEKAFASYFGEGQKNFAPPQPALNGGMFNESSNPHVTDICKHQHKPPTAIPNPNTPAKPSHNPPTKAPQPPSSTKRRARPP